MGITTTELSPIEQTAFLTEYARALDSRWPRPILGDTLAHEVVGKIDYDFAGLGVQTSVVCQTALRAKMLDDRVRAFVGRASRRRRRRPRRRARTAAYYRVGPPPTVRLVQRRPARHHRAARRGAARRPQSHSVPVSVADEHWPDAIPADRPDDAGGRRAVRVPDRSAIVGIFRRITEHFDSGEFAFNDYGRIGWVSRQAIKLYPQKMFKDVGSQFGYPGFKDAHHPETWNPRMRLVEEASLADAQEVDLFPGWIRVATKLSGMSKTGAPQGANPALRVLAQAAGPQQRLQVTHQGRRRRDPQRLVELERRDAVPADQPQMHLRGAGMAGEHLLERAHLVDGALPRRQAHRHRPVDRGVREVGHHKVVGDQRDPVVADR